MQTKIRSKLDLNQLLIILLMIAALVAAFALGGCSTNTPYTVAITLTQAEDAAMKTWASLHNDGKTSAQVDRDVMAAHSRFKSACEVSKSALVAYKVNGDKAPYLQALEAARATVLPILNLILPYLDGAKAVSLQRNVMNATTP